MLLIKKKKYFYLFIASTFAIEKSLSKDIFLETKFKKKWKLR